MTREETQKILMFIQNSFANFKVTDKTSMINTWQFLFEEYDAREVAEAIKAFIKNSGSAFAPSPSQLFEYLYKPVKVQQMNEQEAWGLVMKAIRNSTYHAKEEFEKLPSAAQKAIGSAEQLKEWAMSESFNASVQASLFERTYSRVLKDMEYQERVAPRTDNIIKLSEKVEDALGCTELHKKEQENLQRANMIIG